jgi:Putative Flp pilus-assembly TadE/G-like
MIDLRKEDMSKTRARRGRSQKGSILIMAALVMLTLIAFMGLAFDASYLYFQKRRMQTAADAGAMAGAQELLHRNSTAVVAAARKDSSLNRFTHAVDAIDVAVNNPPSSGDHVGNSGFVEVIVSQPRPTWFAKVFGRTEATVRARAVAGLSDTTGCVYALNRDTSNSNNGIFLNGTTNSKFNCGVFSNANVRTVGGGCLETPGASYSGTYTNSNSSDPNCGPSEVGHGLPAADPMAGRYTLPATSPCGFNNYKPNGSSPITLVPGIYCGGIEIGGSIPSATFTAGTYVLVGGGLKIGSGANATGAGVTFFNTYSGTNLNSYNPVIINTSGTVSFSAPTSGANKALLFWQNPAVPWRSNNGSTITASSTSQFEGILYFPTTDLTYAGNSSSTSPTGGYTLLVAYNLKIAGNAQVNVDFSSLGGASPWQVAAFVE